MHNPSDNELELIKAADFRTILEEDLEKLENILKEIFKNG